MGILGGEALECKAAGGAEGVGKKTTAAAKRQRRSWLAECRRMLSPKAVCESPEVCRLGFEQLDNIPFDPAALPQEILDHRRLHNGHHELAFRLLMCWRLFGDDWPQAADCSTLKSFAATTRRGGVKHEDAVESIMFVVHLVVTTCHANASDQRKREAIAESVTFSVARKEEGSALPLEARANSDAADEGIGFQ